MFGKHPIPLCVALVATLCLSGAARAGWPTVLDTLSPIAHAAVAQPAEFAPAELPETRSHDVDRSNDGLFYVQASVNGRPMRFLVDTGASVMVLTTKDAKALGLSVEQKHFTGTVGTVGGAAPMAWTKIDTVHLAGHEIHNLQAAIVAEGLDVSLLGQNILSQFHSITISADRLSIR